MNTLSVLLWVIAIIAMVYALYYGYLWLTRKTAAKDATSEEVAANLRKAQVVDVRETGEFNANHILGARNIPISQFKLRFGELRKDQAIYLYDDYMNYVPRAARILKKHGYTNLYVLKGGFQTWTGKTKSNLDRK